MVRKYPEFVYASEPTQAQVNDAATQEYGIFVPAGETVKARRDRIAEVVFTALMGTINHVDPDTEENVYELFAETARLAADALIQELDK